MISKEQEKQLSVLERFHEYPLVVIIMTTFNITGYKGMFR